MRRVDLLRNVGSFIFVVSILFAFVVVIGLVFLVVFLVVFVMNGDAIRN